MLLGIGACFAAAILAQGWSLVPRELLGDDVLGALEVQPHPTLPVVLIAFQITDCADARAELALWSGLGGARVIGVLVGPTPVDPAQTRQVLQEASIDLPLRRSNAGVLERLLLALGYEETPVVVGFDGQGRAMALSSLESLGDATSIQAFLAYLRGNGEMTG